MTIKRTVECERSRIAQRFRTPEKQRQPSFYGQSSLRGAVSVGVYVVRGRIGGLESTSSYSTVCCAGLAAATGPELAPPERSLALIYRRWGRQRGSRVGGMTVRRPSGLIQPCQPSKVTRPPSGQLWVHEIKHDGYRLMVRHDGERVRCLTRNGHD
jgi:hypothetical protein